MFTSRLKEIAFSASFDQLVGWEFDAAPPFFGTAATPIFCNKVVAATEHVGNDLKVFVAQEHAKDVVGQKNLKTASKIV